MSSEGEVSDDFDCFGSRCGVLVTGSGRAGSARRGASRSSARCSDLARALLALPARERALALNSDPRETVPVSPLMARFAQAVRDAGSLSGGLVDATLLRELERAGYARDLRTP